MTQSTVAERLFYGSVECRVPEYAFHTKQTMQNEGRLFHVNKDMEQEFLKSYRKVYLSPVALVDYHERGVMCLIAYPSKLVQVYDDILQHLQNWLIVLNGFIIGKSAIPPIEDFAALDAYARFLHPHVIYGKTKARGITKGEFDTRSLDALLGNSLMWLTNNVSNGGFSIEPYESCYEKLVNRYAQVVA